MYACYIYTAQKELSCLVQNIAHFVIALFFVKSHSTS